MTEKKEQDENCRQQESMMPVPPDWFMDTFIGFIILFTAGTVCFLAYVLFNDGILHIVAMVVLACWLTGRALRRWAFHE